MTRKQQEFFTIITNQMFDFNEDFHSDFTIERIEKIQDDKLKILVENITVDKDKIVNKKGFVTYAKFVYYADKLIEEELQTAMLPNHSKVDELYEKRELLLHTIQTQTTNITEKNQLIQDLENKKIMFKDNGKNLLDEIDYFIIDKFGFFNFFDQNKNYMIKEKIDEFYKVYTKEKLTKEKDSTLKLSNETKRQIK